jgi:hypothetical protein
MAVGRLACAHRPVRLPAYFTYGPDLNLAVCPLCLPPLPSPAHFCTAGDVVAYMATGRGRNPIGGRHQSRRPWRNPCPSRELESEGGGVRDRDSQGATTRFPRHILSS